MFQKTVKLPKVTWERVQRASQAGGYSSPDEFVEHVLNRELKKLEDADSDEEIVKKLRGLGYID